MAYLFLILIALALLSAFIFLTQYEAAHGMRFFAPRRAALDEVVERTQFIVTHVDLGAFLADETRRLATIAGHAIAALTLRAVRAVERLLTRMVRYLRTRTETVEMPRESTREFVKNLSEFKETLKTTYPESISEVQ